MKSIDIHENVSALKCSGLEAIFICFIFYKKTSSAVSFFKKKINKADFSFCLIQ